MKGKIPCEYKNIEMHIKIVENKHVKLKKKQKNELLSILYWELMWNFLSRAKAELRILQQKVIKTIQKENKHS